jgi:hypothetical protein
VLYLRVCFASFLQQAPLNITAGLGRCVLVDGQRFYDAATETISNSKTFDYFSFNRRSFSIGVTDVSGLVSN